jgi:hypothetical protein
MAQSSTHMSSANTNNTDANNKVNSTGLSLSWLRLDEQALSLTLCAQIDFEQFDVFAEPLAYILDCRIKERQWGADRHQWLLDFEGSQLWLNYDFYCDVCWISAQQQDDVEVLAYFAGQLSPYVAKQEVEYNG